MCQGNGAPLHRSSQHLCVDAICLSPVMADSHLSAARRVNQQDLVAPFRQTCVDEPSFTACLDCNASGRCLWPEHSFQTSDCLDGQPFHDLPVRHLAVGDALEA